VTTEPAGRQSVARRISARFALALVVALVVAVAVAVTKNPDPASPSGRAVGHDPTGDITNLRMPGAAPSDVDLTAVTVAIDQDRTRIAFQFAAPAVSDELTRAWVWRAWTPGHAEPILTVFVQGGVGATPMAAAIYACPGTGFCTTKADGASFTRTGTTATLTLNRALTKPLTGRFRWAAATYARPHRSAPSGWEDQMPDAALNDQAAAIEFRSDTP